MSRHYVTASLCHAVAAATLLLFGGCANLGYYWQSAGGQLDVWQRERPIVEVIDDPATLPPLKERLALVVEIRDFASRELGLPDNDSYRRYADLQRPFVVWNVFAAPEFSVEPQKWCFLFAGCVSYRGYFSKEAAEAYAAGLAKEGGDVYVGGVPAYSTLGHFADPVLNTFIHYPEAQLARLVFHELAHQVAYAKDDTVFNESFAVTVEQAGVRRWLARSGDTKQQEAFERYGRMRGEFVALVGRHRQKLEALYRTRLAPEAMRVRKQAVIAELEMEYHQLRKAWGGYAAYDRWFAQKPNNAQIASIGLYTQLVPAFEALLAREGGDLPRFYAEVKKLAALPKTERDERMRLLSPSGDRQQ